MKSLKVLLFGHPNVGKSVVFNELTGMYATVSNYPGTTVEIYKGRLTVDDLASTVIDAPGTYSLIPTNLAESVARRVIFDERPDIIVHIVDATSLCRHLYLTLELMILGIPIILAVNQVDRAEKMHIEVDKEALEKALGVPVVLMAAVEGRGVKELIDTIVKEVERGRKPFLKMPRDLEEALNKIEKALKGTLQKRYEGFSKAVAYYIMLKDREFRDLCTSLPKSLVDGLEESGIKMLRFITTMAEEIASSAVRKPPIKAPLAKGIDRYLVHPVLGVTVMSILTFAVIWGSLMMIHGIGHIIPCKIFYPFYDSFIRGVVETFVSGGLIHDLLVGESAGIFSSLGLLTTGVFFVFFMILPCLIVLYLMLGILEDSGLLPRLSVPYNRPLRRIGMSGECICPLIAGSGCSIVGIFLTRTLRSDKEKFIASIVQWFGIPCMAEQVMIWFVLGGGYGSIYVFILYLVLLMSIILVGFLLDRVLGGERVPLILELPVWRRPKMSNVVRKTFIRLKHFITSGVPLVLMGVLMVNLLYYTGWIHAIAGVLSPVISECFRLPSDVAVSLVVGVLRKDIAVGLLKAISVRLTALQMLTAITVLTLYFPCIGALMTTLSEFGVKRTAIMIIIMTFVTLLFGSLLGLASSILP